MALLKFCLLIMTSVAVADQSFHKKLGSIFKQVGSNISAEIFNDYENIPEGEREFFFDLAHAFRKISNFILSEKFTQMFGNIRPNDRKTAAHVSSEARQVQENRQDFLEQLRPAEYSTADCTMIGFQTLIEGFSKFGFSDFIADSKKNGGKKTDGEPIEGEPSLLKEKNENSPALDSTYQDKTAVATPLPYDPFEDVK